MIDNNKNAMPKGRLATVLIMGWEWWNIESFNLFILCHAVVIWLKL
jgi:type IV secretory pathway TrbD component